MKATPIGTRGVQFSVSDPYPVFVYLIRGVYHWFLCDTAFGPDAMTEIRKYIAGQDDSLPLVIFNTHADYDHIWGNCAFEGALVVAHEKCRARMEAHGARELERFAKDRRGDVRLIYPALTFSERLRFPDDGVELRHTPGHTDDSSSCFDTVDRVLVAGDNIETPIPYLVADGGVDPFIRTLEEYRELKPARIISGHDSEPKMQLIEENLEYMRAFRDGTVARYEKEPFNAIHLRNVELARERAERAAGAR